MGNMTISNLNYVVTNLLIEKQFEDIKKSGKEDQYHFVVKGDRFAILQKSDWLVGKIWFQFQVLLGWIKTSDNSKNEIKAKLSRLTKDPEIQQFFALFRSPEIENLKNEISFEKANIVGLKKAYSDTQTNHKVKIEEAIEQTKEEENAKMQKTLDKKIKLITNRFSKENENHINKTKDLEKQIEILEEINNLQKVEISIISKEILEKNDVITDLKKSIQVDFFARVQEQELEAVEENYYANQLKISSSSDDEVLDQKDNELDENIESPSVESLISQLSSDFDKTF